MISTDTVYKKKNINDRDYNFISIKNDYSIHP